MIADVIVAYVLLAVHFLVHFQSTVNDYIKLW